MKHKLRILEKSASELENWIINHEYKGYEPFDGLSSPFHKLTKNNLFLERVLQQIVRQCPINIRPLLGVHPKESTKGRAFIAWGYLNKFLCSGKDNYKENVCELLNWLKINKSPYYKEHTWGNHFPYASRFGSLPIYEPTIVWTSLIGQVFLEAYEALNYSDYIDIAKSICTWIMKLSREIVDDGVCISYVAMDQRSIHNSNMLGAAMLARTAFHTGDAEYLDVAKKAMRYSCKGQLKDGAWYYGEEKKYHWIDSFHTGYNLDSLKRYSIFTRDKDFDSYLYKGYEYFRNHFFCSDGAPKYYHNRLYPIDIQCASQSIDTLVLFSDYDSSALDMAIKVALWTIANMQSQDGHFYYRKYASVMARAPMIHWGQATMFKALHALLRKLREN